MKKQSIIFGLTLGLTLGITGTYAANTIFKDVSTDHWAKTAVEWAKNNDLVDGYEDQTFRGNNNLSRYEMVQILSKYDKKIDRQLNMAEQETNRLQVQLGLREMGNIKKFYEQEGKFYIDFDNTQLLSGDEAKAEMVKDGLCKEILQCNSIVGFYINNDDATIKTLEVFEGGDFRFIQNDGSTWEHMSLKEFKDTFTNPGDKYVEGPYWVEYSQKGQIASVQQQFLP